MKLRPLHDRVIIKRLEAETKSAGGIVIPDTATEKPIKGEVIAVGAGKILENGNVRALAVKAGDKVLFGKYSGTEVKVDGEELLVMREEGLVAGIGGLTRTLARCLEASRASAKAAGRMQKDGLLGEAGAEPSNIQPAKRAQHPSHQTIQRRTFQIP